MNTNNLVNKFWSNGLTKAPIFGLMINIIGNKSIYKNHKLNNRILNKKINYDKQVKSTNHKQT